MDEIKGDLRGARGFIIKLKIRDANGFPQHKASFRLDDTKTLVRELNLLKDKFGVECFELKNKYKKEAIKEQLEDLGGEDWREKTRGLREINKDIQKKVREAL
jgi:hypothetical protein